MSYLFHPYAYFLVAPSSRYCFPPSMPPLFMSSSTPPDDAAMVGARNRRPRQPLPEGGSEPGLTRSNVDLVPRLLRRSLIPLAAGHDILAMYHVKSSVSAITTVNMLAYLPVRREIVRRSSAHVVPIANKHRVISLLVQATGVEARVPCTKCARGNGPWTTCVVSHGAEGTEATRGACANCCWANQGASCGFCTLYPPSQRMNFTDAL